LSIVQATLETQTWVVASQALQSVTELQSVAGTQGPQQPFRTLATSPAAQIGEGMAQAIWFQSQLNPTTH